jgi:hypothetical protein
MSAAAALKDTCSESELLRFGVCFLYSEFLSFALFAMLLLTLSYFDRQGWHRRLGSCCQSLRPQRQGGQFQDGHNEGPVPREEGHR